jgi:hypothetical protein
MFDKIKRLLFQFVVLAVNATLVTGGVLFIRNQQQKKQDQQDLALNADMNQEQQEVATQAQQLQQIVDQNRNNKYDAVANNPPSVTVQKPVAVTQVIPAKTTTVKVPVKSTSAKTTKTS